MAENKRQHFVPQFYMKNFSTDKFHINAFNVLTKKTTYTQIKTSCRENYFYGKDIEIEKFLNSLETIQAKIISEIISTKFVDLSLTEKHGILLSFLLMQKMRTQSNKIRSNLFLNDFISKYIKPIMKSDKRFEEFSDDHIQGLKFESPDFFYKTGIPILLESFFAIMDLQPIVIEINSNKEFITSDTPVIFNNYVDFKEYPLLGLVSPGLQIICPLTSKLMLLLLDNDIYKVKKTSISGSDIDAFNEIQLKNCNENVFFNNKDLQKNIENLFAKDNNKKKKKRIEFTILSKNRDAAKQEYNETHRVSSTEINYCQKFSFIGLNHENNRKLKEKLKKISKNNHPGVLYRNEIIFEKLNELRDRKIGESINK